MSTRGGPAIVGAFEHPSRHAPDLSISQLHAQSAAGALADAGLTFDDVDGYCAAGDAPGFGAVSMAEYMGLKVRHLDSTDTGGSANLIHVANAVAAIEAGLCRVVLVTLAGKPRTGGSGLEVTGQQLGAPEYAFEQPFGPTAASFYAMAARRHMHDYGTTPEQLAAVKVTASEHAQHNPRAFLPNPVTLDDVLSSPYVAEPLHRLDCCVITDGGGAVVVVSDDVAQSLDRQGVRVLGSGVAPRHMQAGRGGLTATGAVWSGPEAFRQAGITHADVDYASIYDSFTITVVETIEDLGFCAKGQGGPFVADGGLRAPDGPLPFNTDGGGLCNNHPGNRGGMTKMLEAVRQLRGEAAPEVQVPGCDVAVAHATGGRIGARVCSATLVLGAA